MSTSVLPAQKISPVRTFASDIAAVRSTGQKMNASSSLVGTTVQKIATPKATVAVVPIPTKKPVVKNTPAADAAIPPFHTFSKPIVKKSSPLNVTPIDTTDVTKTTQSRAQSTLTAPSHGVMVGDGADVENNATVITDTKHNRFSVTGAVMGNLTDWYTQQKKNLNGESKPKYTLPEADRRRGVIQKATSQTGRMTTADHAAVLAKLRTARSKNQPVTKSSPVTMAVSTPPVWETAQQDTTATQLTSPAHSSASELPRVNPIISTKIPDPKVEGGVQQKNITPIIPTLPPVSAKNSPTTFTEPVSPIIPITRTKITPIIPQTSAVITNQSRPIATQPVAVMTVSSASTTAITEPTLVIPSIPTPPTNTRAKSPTKIKIPRYVYITIGGLVILGSIGGLFLVLTPTETPTPITTTRIISDESAPTIDVTPDFFLVSTKEDIVSALTSQMNDEVSLSEIKLLSRTTGAPLSPTEFFTAFDIQVPISFVTAINQIKFGVYRGEPWLTLIMSDTPTGQGGMFTWEKTIMNDIKPWFSAETPNINLSQKNIFTDSIIDARDVRLQKDTQSDYQVLYGFINSNEILITTNDTSWLNLEQKLNGGL